MLTVDEMIPASFRSWILCLFGVLGTLFVICLATPLFTAVVVPIAVVYYFVQVIVQKCQSTFREVFEIGLKSSEAD